MTNSEDTPPGKRRFFRLDLGPHHVERDVDTELAFHLEMRIRRLVQRGMDPVSARAQALRQFGDWNLVRAQMLDIDYQQEKTVKRANYFAELRQDVLYALRSLRNHLGFALVVILSLAIGIGANTAVFTLIDALLLRPLPVPNAERLVAFGNTLRTNSASDGSVRTDLFSYPTYVALRKDTPLLSGLAAMGRTGRLDLIIDDRAPAPSGQRRDPLEPEHARGRLVSGNYFAVLGVPAMIGRPITTQDDRVANGSPVVVLSYAYWQRRFARDPAVIGRTITVNRTPFTIVGVTPPGFHGEVVGRMTDVWMPLTMQPAVDSRNWLDVPTQSWLLLLGRRMPNVTLAQVRAAYTTLIRQAAAATAPSSELAARVPTQAVPISSGARGLSPIRGIYREALATLMGAVALVLLVVCANVANLLLARGASRSRELGVRMALGAGRTRLVRQLLTECVLLGALGGALGLVFASWGSRALLRLAAGGPGTVPLDVRLDWRVLGFTATLTGLTALLFGLVPAVRATRVELATTLRAGSRGLTGGLLGGPGRIGIGKLLVALQVAMSLTLLVGTSMLVRSTRALTKIDPGLARDQLLIVTVDAAPTGQEDERLAQLSRTLLERIRRIPGIAAASFSENGIFSGTESFTNVEVPGFAARTDADSSANYDRVGPAYFTAIGARLLAGRDFTENDNDRSPRVTVINSTMASSYFPNGDAIGKRIRAEGEIYEVVGIVGDTKDHHLRQQPTRRLYLPVYQAGPMPMQFTFELRATGNPAQLVAAVRRELRTANASLSVLSNDPLTSLMRQSITQDLLVARVASFFGMLALALAALGLYGVMMYATLRRTSEFGLRMALGAEPRRVGKMVLGEAMRLVAGGAVIGLPLAILTTRLLRNQLYGVELVDTPSIIVALTVLAVSAAIAGYLPATRAARVGPLEALRTD
jgi:putative ABC transport system permease protein